MTPPSLLPLGFFISPPPSWLYAILLVRTANACPHCRRSSESLSLLALAIATERDGQHDFPRETVGGWGRAIHESNGKKDAATANNRETGGCWGWATHASKRTDGVDSGDNRKQLRDGHGLRREKPANLGPTKRIAMAKENCWETGAAKHTSYTCKYKDQQREQQWRHETVQRRAVTEDGQHMNFKHPRST